MYDVGTRIVERHGVHRYATEIRVILQCIHQSWCELKQRLHVFALHNDFLHRVPVYGAYYLLLVVTLCLEVRHEQLCKFYGMALASAKVKLYAVAVYSIEQLLHELCAYCLSWDFERK